MVIIIITFNLREGRKKCAIIFECWFLSSTLELKLEENLLYFFLEQFSISVSFVDIGLDYLLSLLFFHFSQSLCDFVCFIFFYFILAVGFLCHYIYIYIYYIFFIILF